MKAARRPLTPEQALDRMEALCARAEYSSGEIREKLYGKGLTPAQIDEIIESLVRRRFIDDARFAAVFVRDKVAYSGWGRMKISAALYQKRVARDIIAAALDEIDMDVYTERLRSLIRAKLSTFSDPTSYDSRAKAFRHAASRGFESDLIARYLDLEL